VNLRCAAAGKWGIALCCSICNEFLEDWHKDQPLLPADPVDRAHARMLIDRFSSKYVPNFYSILVRQVRCPWRHQPMSALRE
jgi:glutathione S-transferase